MSMASLIFRFLVLSLYGALLSVAFELISCPICARSSCFH
ncbi:unnamed protein product [Protopolystoma xenopodis]|uniref:Uncharacterized protein n=1 Tax=Protopolystoma xenopodis TaxID=117903 RepID=A0A3S5BSI1_9PLAT|nr:unnamed protein product [Protopolystoma xenopodis]